MTISDVDALDELVVRLRTARLERGLTQAQVALLVGIEQAALCGWEAGRRRPQDGNLARWAAVLEVDVPEGVSGWHEPSHGSPSGYRRHLYRDETPCAQCRSAQAAYRRRLL